MAGSRSELGLSMRKAAGVRCPRWTALNADNGTDKTKLNTIGTSQSEINPPTTQQPATDPKQSQPNETPATCAADTQRAHHGVAGPRVPLLCATAGRASTALGLLDHQDRRIRQSTMHDLDQKRAQGRTGRPPNTRLAALPLAAMIPAHLRSWASAASHT